MSQITSKPQDRRTDAELEALLGIARSYTIAGSGNATAIDKDRSPLDHDSTLLRRFADMRFKKVKRRREPGTGVTMINASGYEFEVFENDQPTADDSQPPEFATYLLWYLPKEVREAVTGDLEEEFSIVYNRFGQRKAIIWYYYQVGASFWPFVVSKVQKLVKWGVVGWISEALRRFIS
jgi:hypothetical protein